MNSVEKRKIVISAVNLVEGGTLSILKDCVAYLNEKYTDKYEIIALVHDRNLLESVDNVTIQEWPAIKKSWLKRFKFEYVDSLKLSKKWNPYLWLCLHDMTALVKADIQAVYCHNPSPFYKASFTDAKYDRTFFLFSKFYKFLYRLFINRNTYVIVQQDWIRTKFEVFCSAEIVVAYPDFKLQKREVAGAVSSKKVFSFFYPSLARVFKNFEVLFDAVGLLEKKGLNCEMIVTIDGTENAYSQQLVEKYREYKSIRFAGRQSRDNVMALYEKVDALIFPSRLETWGLPITEMKMFGKPILLSDLEYAHETMGEYDKAKFFNCDNAEELSGYMEELMNNTLVFDKTEVKMPAPLFVNGWESFFNLILNKR